jgi:hypothetical protein
MPAEAKSIPADAIDQNFGEPSVSSQALETLSMLDTKYVTQTSRDPIWRLSLININIFARTGQTDNYFFDCEFVHYISPEDSEDLHQVVVLNQYGTPILDDVYNYENDDKNRYTIKPRDLQEDSRNKHARIRQIFCGELKHKRIFGYGIAKDLKHLSKHIQGTTCIGIYDLSFLPHAKRETFKIFSNEKQELKEVYRKYFPNDPIQEGTHNASEDAMACCKLFAIWESTLRNGDLNSIEMYHTKKYMKNN